jgi:hypothetical protein
MYGGIANRVGGGHIAASKTTDMSIGINYGPVYGGLLINPDNVVQNFIDTYKVITGEYDYDGHD